MDVQRPAGDVALGHQAIEEGNTEESNARATWLAWSLLTIFILLAAFSVPLEIANSSVPSPVDPKQSLQPPFDPSRQLILLAYATVGALVASRRPKNAIGWIFSTIAFCLMFGIFAVDYALYTSFVRPGALPLGQAMTWLSIFVQQVGFLLVITFLPLLFPDGRLPSARWRPVAWAAAIVILVVDLSEAFRPGPLPFAPALSNPLGVEQVTGVDEYLTVITIALMVLVVAACAVSVIVRFRRAKGDERQQLKWFTYAAVPVIIIITSNPLIATQAPGLDFAYEVLFRLSVAALPVAAGIAILKYRLYDIDILINRTLVYVPLTAILAGLYSASIALFQKLFVGLTGANSDAAIVLTTLVLASSFTPIKTALQGFVDRRFKEAPDTTKKLKALGDQARAVVEVTDINRATRRLLDEAVDAFGAQSGAVYLWRDGQLELTHVHGEWVAENTMLSVRLERDGRQLGLLQLGARSGGVDYTMQDRVTLEQVAGEVAEAIGQG